jgi:hypothetical protein
MNWMFPLAVTLVLALVTMSPSTADAQFLTTAPNIPGDPGLDSALGSGHVAATDLEVLINVAAHSGPLGQNPAGHYHLETVPGNASITVELDADITCLTVVGNLARVGGFVTKFTENGVPVTGVQGILETVEDNHLLGTPDMVGTIFTLPAAPSICPPPVPGEANIPINQGNIVVHDADL